MLQKSKSGVCRVLVTASSNRVSFLHTEIPRCLVLPQNLSFLHIEIPRCLVLPQTPFLSSYSNTAMSCPSSNAFPFFIFKYRNVLFFLKHLSFLHIQIPRCLVLPQMPFLSSYWNTAMSCSSSNAFPFFILKYRDVLFFLKCLSFLYSEIPWCLVLPQNAFPFFILKYRDVFFFLRCLPFLYSEIPWCLVLPQNAFSFFIWKCRDVLTVLSLKPFFSSYGNNVMLFVFQTPFFSSYRNTLSSYWNTAMSCSSSNTFPFFIFKYRDVLSFLKCLSFLHIELPRWLVLPQTPHFSSYRNTTMTCSSSKAPLFFIQEYHDDLFFKHPSFLHTEIPWWHVLQTTYFFSYRNTMMPFSCSSLFVSLLLKYHVRRHERFQTVLSSSCWNAGGFPRSLSSTVLIFTRKIIRLPWHLEPCQTPFWFFLPKWCNDALLISRS